MLHMINYLIVVTKIYTNTVLSSLKSFNVKKKV